MVTGYKQTELGIIPNDWNVELLGNIASPKARIGWQNLRKDEFLDSGDFMLITGTDFENGKINYKICKYVSKERYLQDENIQVKNGDILITKDGTLGKVAFVQELHMPATLNAGVFVLTGLSNEVNNRFLYQYLCTEKLMKYAEKTSTGGTIQHLNQGVLVNFPIPIPPLKEQKRIAQSLFDMDTLIAKSEQAIKKYRALKQTCLQHMFPRAGQTEPDIRLPGFTGPWEQRKLGDIVDFLDTQRKPLTENIREKGPYPYYGASGIVDYVAGYIFDEELVLLSEDGANITDRNYPVCFLASGKYWVNNHAHVLKTKEGIDNNFICNSLECKDFSIYNTGMAMPKLNQDICKKIPVDFPTYDEQEKIGNYFRNIDYFITLHQRTCEKYKKIKQGMMEELLSGKIRLV